jgi:transcriptional regulator with XRE-family HTH domain
MDETPEELAFEEAGWVKMGQHLRQRRLEKAWLQEDLAERSGVSVASIRAIENHPPNRRYRDVTLENLSLTLGEPGDYLSRYQQEHRIVEPGDQPEAAKARRLPRATGRRTPARAAELVPQLDEVVVSRLNELVVPRLEAMEEQLHVLADIIHRTYGIEVDLRHPGDAE